MIVGSGSMECQNGRGRCEWRRNFVGVGENYEGGSMECSGGGWMVRVGDSVLILAQRGWGGRRVHS